ncbi:MAG: hypothetical protein J6A59_15885 [Lachnospiraceae bacterium]|nr:hypothetical protein [Lachnospiraceae bacterium]
MSSIKVDISELIDKLEAMLEDDFITAQLTIVDDDYVSELAVDAVGIDEDDSRSYGSITETTSDF